MIAMPSLFDLWQVLAPQLLLASAVVLLLTGYPVAFVLGTLSAVFAFAGLSLGWIPMADLHQMLRDLIAKEMLDPTLYPVPLVILLTELMVQTGLMAGASRAIKGLFDPTVYRPNGVAKNGRRPNRRPERSKTASGQQRSILLAIALPAALMGIFLARFLNLPAQALAFALFIPASALLLLYFADWVMDLWNEAFRRQMQAQLAPLTGAAPRRPWLRILFACLLPPAFIGLSLFMAFYSRLTIFDSLAVLCVVLILGAFLMGRLNPYQLFCAMNRSALATTNVVAMLIASLAFLQTFSLMGGAAQLDQLAQWLAAMTVGMHVWLQLFVLLFALLLLGLYIDWMILVLVILPLLAPFMGLLDYHSLLMTAWDIQGSASSENLVNGLNWGGIYLPHKLWLASLLWITLMTALVTYSRQNGELAQKELVSWTGKIKDSPASVMLFFTLQIIGLGAVIIIPGLVLWLPSIMMP